MEVKTKQALKGVRIIEFSFVAMIPFATRILAEHGATVVKVESTRRVDEFRGMPPYAEDRPGINRSLVFAAHNNDKYSLQLDLKHPKGLEVARRLVLSADVVIDNFRPGTMEDLGLGYPDLKKIKPDIIVTHGTIQGHTGILARRGGFGTVLQALAGFTYLVGWPDKAPSGFSMAYTDFVAGWYVAIAVLGALDYRNKTQKGQCIDLSQIEASLPFLSTAVLDYTANKRVMAAKGNRADYAAPHGVFRCCGDDAWCAITVYSEEEWQAFCKVVGANWMFDPKFNGTRSRKENEDELERLIEEWTMQYTPNDVMKKLQTAGVPAGIVQSNKELWEDPQLAHRHHFHYVRHPEMGMTPYETFSFKLSETPAQIRTAAPCLGEHTEYVCKEMLGMDDAEFLNLLAEGVFT